jgi:glucosamine--fructose-6-phosphate aminotransferase (isomerizing)
MKLAVVHNGMITNYAELKKEVQRLGIEMKTDTDSELIPQLTSLFIGQGLTTMEAFSKTFSMLEGSNSIALLNKEEGEKIYIAKNSGSLHVGILDNGGYIAASEIAVFQNYTNKYYTVEDMTVVCLEKGTPQITVKISTCEKEKIHEKPAPGFGSFLE